MFFIKSPNVGKLAFYSQFQLTLSTGCVAVCDARSAVTGLGVSASPSVMLSNLSRQGLSTLNFWMADKNSFGFVPNWNWKHFKCKTQSIFFVFIKKCYSWLMVKHYIHIKRQFTCSARSTVEIEKYLFSNNKYPSRGLPVMEMTTWLKTQA